MQKKKRIGLLGGTFNPVHNGHLFLAEEAHHLMGLDEVVFVPNRVPPHKELPGVDSEKRYAMLLAATQGLAHFSVSRVELDREGASYTVDTLDAFSQYDVTFICGADAFNAPWYRLDDVLDKLSHIVLANRAGYEFVMPEQLKALSNSRTQKVRMMEFPDISISSSAIRERVQQQRPFRFLVPSEVYEFINKTELYQQTSTH